MNRTKIPWADYTINPVKGLCPMACSYCYARKMYKRFKWNPDIRFEADAITYLPAHRVRIFVGSTMELFGDWVKPEWMELIFWRIKTIYSQHTFIFLTKQPQNLIKWSPFPENCWVGVSVTNNDQLYEAQFLAQINATVKFISIEPLLERLGVSVIGSPSLPLDWLIIGSQTQPVKHPKEEWVDEIIEAADKAKIPVFVKEPLASYIGIQRQEFPAGANMATW